MIKRGIAPLFFYSNAECPLDFSGPLTTAAGRIFIIHPGTKKSMHFLHKKRSAFSPDFVGSDERKFLTFGVTGVIISIESERGERRKASEKSSKNLLTNRFQSAIMVIEDKRNERQTATASS